MSSASDRTERSAQEMNEAIGPEVTVPGPYPSDQVSGPSAETGSQSEPSKATRATKSFGDAAEHVHYGGGDRRYGRTYLRRPGHREN